MKGDEGELGSRVADTPDGNVAGCEQITGPASEQIAWVPTYPWVVPLTPMVSRKDGDGWHDYPIYVDRTLQEASVNDVAHRDYESKGSQIITGCSPSSSVGADQGYDQAYDLRCSSATMVCR